MDCQKIYLLNRSEGHFSRSKMPEKVKFVYFATLWQFSQKWSDNFFFAYSFLGLILIKCQEIDFFELFERSFSRSKRSFDPFSHNY